MADPRDPRLYRGQDAAYRQDGYGDAGSGTPAPNANDPLAELARLIGNDSFNANRHGAASAPMQPEWPDQSGAPSETDAYREGGYDYPPPDPRGAYADHYAQQNFSEPAAQQPGETYPDYPADPNASYDPSYAMQPPAHQTDYAQPQGYDEQAATQYADAYHPTAPSQIGAPPEFLGRRGGFPAAGYEADAHGQTAHDPYYDDAPPRRSRAILMAGAAAALVVVGTAGAFGYRALFGSSSSGPPPVIKADASPTKIVAAAPRDVSNKSSDRIGDQLNERVVSREEQPGDARPQPRVVFPGPAATGNAPQGANASVAGEPKKIRTVAIRPDQPGDSDPGAASRAAPPAPAPAARSANVPAAVPAVQPAPRQVAPAAPAASNGPLSLSPDAGASSAAVAPPARAAARPALQAAVPQAAAPAAAAGPGAYVQVSSQRSEGDAQASYRALQAKYPAVLGSRTASIQRADLGEKGTYYRAMVGPLDGPSAVDLCTNLKAAGGSCVIQKN